MEEEVSSPERDGKAMNGVAKVKCDPEVLGISICKDVLQGKTGQLRAVHSQRPPTLPPKRKHTYVGKWGARP